MIDTVLLLKLPDLIVQNTFIYMVFPCSWISPPVPEDIRSAVRTDWLLFLSHSAGNGEISFPSLPGLPCGKHPPSAEYCPPSQWPCFAITAAVTPISIASHAWDGLPIPASTITGRSISSTRIWINSSRTQPFVGTDRRSPEASHMPRLPPPDPARYSDQGTYMALPVKPSFRQNFRGFHGLLIVRKEIPGISHDLNFLPDHFRIPLWIIWQSAQPPPQFWRRKCSAEVLRCPEYNPGYLPFPLH